MKMLLDSQISPQVATWLRKAGHDVREVRTDSLLHGATDDMLVQTAWREGRVLVSVVPAFARLISRQGSWRPGTILLLAGDPRPRAQMQILQTLLARVPEAKLMTSLAIAEGYRVRLYPLVEQPIPQVTPELQSRPPEPLPSPARVSVSEASLICPVCGATMKPLPTCKQICPACGHLNSCSMD